MTKAEQIFLALVAIGSFSVDNHGRVWRHRRMVGGSKTGSPSYEANLPNPERAERSETTGYPKVMFSYNQERMTVFAHRIVWMYHNKADIPNGMEINHKDGVRHNSHPDNLELVTRSENALHGIHVLGRNPKAQQGEQNASAKLTVQDVLTIRRLCVEKAMPQSQIAKLYGVTQATISAIHMRKSWNHIA